MPSCGNASWSSWPAAAAIAEALRGRGVTDPAASLTAEAGVAVFRIAFARWIAAHGRQGLAKHIRESLDELKPVTAGLLTASANQAKTLLADPPQRCYTDISCSKCRPRYKCRKWEPRYRNSSDGGARGRTRAIVYAVNGLASAYPKSASADTPGGEIGMSMNNIEHVVVLMLENRSFDSMLGWLYERTRLKVIPQPKEASDRFRGLQSVNLNSFVNPSPDGTFSAVPTRGVQGFTVPSVDLGEEFPHVHTQFSTACIPKPQRIPYLDDGAGGRLCPDRPRPAVGAANVRPARSDVPGNLYRPFSSPSSASSPGTTRSATTGLPRSLRRPTPIALS